MTRFLPLLLICVLAGCDTAPPDGPPSGELPCAGVTADGTWEALSPPDFPVARLRLHGQHLFAVALRNDFNVTTIGEGGLWWRDLRASPSAPWDSLGLARDSTLGISGVVDVLADPSDPDRIMAAVDPLGLPGADHPSVLRTTDGGRTWADVSDDETFLVRPDFRVAVRRLYGEADGEQPGTVLAVASGYTFRTHDYGGSWERVADSDLTGTGPALLYPFLNAAERHPAHPDVLWTGSSNTSFQIFLSGSADGGQTWAFAYVCPPLCADSNPTAFAFDAADQHVVYLGTTGWRVLLKSEDFGVTWRNIDTLRVGDYEALVGHPTEPGRLWGGLYRGAANPRLMMVETADGGATWREIEVPEGVVAEGARVRDFAWEAEEEAILIGTTHGVYRYRPGFTTELECN